MNNLIKLVEDEMKTASKEFPLFAPGDIITVEYRIREGNKERIQSYRGTVIAIKGHGSKRRFNVRKISDRVAVERIFPLDSPFVENVRVERHGKVPALSCTTYALSVERVLVLRSVVSFPRV